MNPARHAQVKRLFFAACELGPEAAAAFLEQACGEDRELLKEVESLLAHHTASTLLPPVDGQAETTPLVPGQMTDPDAVAVSEEQRIPVGEVVAGRYRVLGLLGRGGVGEVYRAHDLRLGQDVALKFLRADRLSRPTRWADFAAEVRLARRVSHPNVNRVHDLGEWNGERFISMELVEGEDLGSLLRREGPMTADAAIDLGRQLAAGLGAAHDRGVLHRDLKPANVMIDAAGQVRLTDFGIALEGHSDEPAVLVGTPQYMAPELFSGATPTVQSDLFALGMVLADCLGGRASPAPTEPAAAKAQGGPRARLPADTPEALADVIECCLAFDPTRRPKSAYEVLAALPGRDPVQAALDEGRLPSPQAVAATTLKRPLSTLDTWRLAGLVAVLLLIVVLLSDRTHLAPRTRQTTPPEEMAEKAHSTLAQLGYETDRANYEHGYSSEPDHPDRTAGPTLEAPALQWPEDRQENLLYWYHADADADTPPAWGELPRELSDGDEAPVVQLDAAGHLRAFHAPVDAVGAAKPAPPWADVFRLADLDYQGARPSTPQGQPPAGLEHWQLWRIDRPNAPPQYVHAALVDGRLALFAVRPTANLAELQLAVERGGSPTREFLFRVTIQVSLLAVSLVLAVRNLRSGAADLRGAGALAALVAALCALEWVFYVRHSHEFIEEVAASYWWLAHSSLLIVFAGAGYLGLEPLVRARWPQTLVGLERLERGNWRDGVVAREVLLGVVVGVAAQLLLQALCLWPPSPGGGPAIGLAGDGRNWLGLWPALGTIVHLAINALWVGLGSLLLLCVLRILTRRDWLAGIAFCLLFAGLQVVRHDWPFDRGGAVGLLQAVGLWLLISRGGALAAVVGPIVFGMLAVAPLTTHLGAWYAGAALLSLGCVVGLVALAIWLRGGATPWHFKHATAAAA
ncbi:MAG: serine/threonine-protein kinase [Pirellulales bacterium]